MSGSAGPHPGPVPLASALAPSSPAGFVAPDADPPAEETVTVDDTAVGDTAVGDTAVDDTAVDDTAVDDTVPVGEDETGGAAPGPAAPRGRRRRLVDPPWRRSHPPHPVPRPVEIAERAVAVVALGLLTGGPVPLLFIMADAWRGENDGRMFVWLWVFLAWLVGVCWVHRRTILPGLWRAGPLFVLSGWALLSRFWSIDRGVTTLRAVALLTCALFGAYLGRRFTRREQLRLLGLGLLAAALLSVFFRLFVHLPQSTTVFSGGWQGIYLHSNYLGAVAAFSVVVTALCMTGPGRERWLWVPPLALHLLLLQKSIAAAAQFNALFALMILGLAWLYQAVRRREGQWVGVLAGAGGLIVVAMGVLGLQTGRVAERLERSGDWSNRIALWKAIWPWLAERPVEGFGYAAMWTYKGGWAKQIELAWNKQTGVPHAHNGFLDTWLGTGLLGFEVLLAVCAVAFARAVIDLYRGKTAVSSWPIVVWFFVVLSSLTESVMLAAPSIHLVALGAIMAGGGLVPLTQALRTGTARRRRSRPAPAVRPDALVAGNGVP